MSFDLDANTASELARIKRQYRKGTQQDGLKAILGDELGRISVDAERYYYYVRVVNGEDSTGNTQYGHAFPVLSGGNYFGSEKVGHEVWIAHIIDGQLAVIMSDRQAITEKGKNPRGENPNSPYNKFRYMKNADLFLAKPLNTVQTPGFEVRVEPAWYIDENNDFAMFPGGVIDLVGDVPAVDGDGNNQHLISGVFINSSGVLESVTSTVKPVGTTLIWDTDVVEVWDARSARAFPIRYYKLFSGQTLLTEGDDWGDGREWITAPKRRNNFTAIIAPTVDDDIDLRYEVGSVWVDVTADRSYICIDSTDGAAIWQRYVPFETSEDAFRAPNGFEKAADAEPPTDSTITYDSGTRTISIAPTGTSFNYWLRGERYTISSAQELTHADTTGIYFFYWNSSNVLTFSTTAWSIVDDVPITYVYYNSTKVTGIHYEERHGATRNVNWHYSDHYKRGTFWHQGEGLGISGYTLQPGSPADSDNQWAIASGEIHDEDIAFQVTGRTAGTYEIFYRTGASGEWTWTQNNVPLLSGGSYLYWNEWTGATWQQTAAANNNYVNYYIMTTSSLDSDFDVFAIMGQAVHSTLLGAQSEDVSDLDFGTLPFQELLSIYKVTFRTGASYSTEGKCRVEAVADTRETTGAQIVSGTPGNSHPSLSGLVWAGSGHIGTADTIAAFDSSGAATEININGWLSYSAVIPTRTTADDPTYVITFAGVDLTGLMSVGMKIKWTQNSTVRYGIITAIAFSTNTTLTLYGGTDYDVDDTGSFAISAFNYSPVKTPHGFPMERELWTYEISDSTDRAQATPTAGVWYNLGSVSIDIPIGNWKVEYNVAIHSASQAAQVSTGIYSSLSTGASSESDSDFRGAIFNTMPSGTLGTGSVIQICKDLTIASKTTYYLISSATNANTASITNFNSAIKPAKIRAYCNYL